MARLCRSLIRVSWGLGLLCTVLGVLIRLVPYLEAKSTFTARGVLILAGVLFLCALATREMERTVTPGS